MTLHITREQARCFLALYHFTPTDINLAANLWRSESFDKAIRVRPTIDTDAKAIADKNTAQLCIGQFELGVVIVVLDAATDTNFIVYHVGRVSQDEINALGMKLRQYGQAAAVNNSISDVGK